MSINESTNLVSDTNSSLNQREIQPAKSKSLTLIQSISRICLLTKRIQGGTVYTLQ